MRLPVVAIVGRPNVGKSTLFNRLIGERLAIVEDTPGVTRDRLYGDAEWFGRHFSVVDTGGYEPRTEDPLLVGMREQARIAMLEADLICLVVDGLAGLNGGDAEIARMLRRGQRPLLVAVNKIDGARNEVLAAEFHALGIDDVIPVSAAHGRGVGDLVDRFIELLDPPRDRDLEEERDRERADDEAAARRLARAAAHAARSGKGKHAPADPDDDFADLYDEEPDEEFDEELDEELDEGLDEGLDEDALTAGDDQDAASDPAAETSDLAAVPRVEVPAARECRVAFVGRPNVGKSSLVNRLLGQPRSLVSDEAGTTRDPVDTELVRGNKRYRLVDTAGLRRKAKVRLDLERYTVVRSLRAIDRCHVICFLVDAREGVSDQDQRIAQYATRRGRAAVILLNKWDLMETRDSKALDKLVKKLREEQAFLPHAPVLVISAKTGRSVDKILPLIDSVRESHLTRVPTGPLNRLFKQIVDSHHPPVHYGHLVKMFYITQTGIAPPTFVISCNYPDGVPDAYRRYVENRIREVYPFTGAPLRFDYQQRGATPDETPRRSTRSRKTGGRGARKRG